MIGHEFSAVIAETGPGVTAFRPGDRVAVLPHVFCGSCFYCLRGRQGLCSNLKLTGVTWPWGGLAGQAIVPASQVVPLPDGVSFEQGAVLEPLATVVHGVERSGLRPGDSVLITGGGPIGQLAVLVAAAAGAGLDLPVRAAGRPAADGRAQRRGGLRPGVGRRRRRSG